MNEGSRVAAAAIAIAVTAAWPTADAQDRDPTGSDAGVAEPSSPAPERATGEPPPTAPALFGAEAVAPALSTSGDEESVESLGRSRVSRRQLEERLPQSSPEALRYEPGVYIQQTAHGQASPFIRGLTGQQVVHVFDGVRMNNGTYRQGPNQYFFTVDSRSVRRLDVIRGSASTRFGSDALGGAILATPMDPFVDPENAGLDAEGRALLRYGSADRELGGRLELEFRLGPRTALLLGGGYRDVSLLESGGVVYGVTERRDTIAPTRGDTAPWVPRFAEEAAAPNDPDRWRTQLGTGFRELTFDTRLVHRLSEDLELVTALYGYRQFDAPRTDACPPPEAPIDECLTFDQQFRTLGYAQLRGHAGREMRDLRLTLSLQHHRESRRRDRPRSNVRFDWRDNVTTLGASFSAKTRDFELTDSAKWSLRYGIDAYRDAVTSDASQTFTDIARRFELSRGQYLSGSRFALLGGFVELAVTPTPWMTLRSGGRASYAGIRAPRDPESGSLAISKDFAAAVGRAGIELRPSAVLTLYGNVDQGFRAPNLDDLTARQQTGPGFQFENPDLEPERSVTVEVGARGDLDWLQLEGWAFATFLDGAIIRSVRDATDCPPETPQCRASRNQLQLINATEGAFLWGVEGGVTAYLPKDVSVRATVSYTWGEGPNTGARAGDPTFGQARVPLSRVPPANGTVEVMYRHRESGFYTGAACRWALDQTRLAPSDRFDARIPPGGTPGYAVFDLRAGWRLRRRFRLALIAENLFDAAWRAHGSSINGPGRGLRAEAAVGF